MPLKIRIMKTAEQFLKDNNVYEETIVFKNNERTINRKRKWGKPNADGVVNHIRE